MEPRIRSVSHSSQRPPGSRDLDAESSVNLLALAKDGDEDALNVLFARYLVPLRRWARGRLPRWARDITDTEDLVQDTLLQTFKRIELFEPERSGALQAYLRQAVMNRICNEFRRSRRRGPAVELDTEAPADDPSPLDEAIGAELLDEYDRALERLKPEEREAIVGRIEMDLTYEELAETMGRPTANAARSAVVRALLRLAEEMGRD
jgi:RNA polymerase sigma-70 factor (ECF subfamily)